MGADIGWESLGNDDYKVTVSVYRDCGGVNLVNSRIRFESKGKYSDISTTTQQMSAGIDITPIVCPGQCTRCTSPNCSYQYGLEKYELTTVISVALLRQKNVCDVKISWTQCCRDGIITTGAANQNYFVDAQLNVCLQPEDNAPIFVDNPIAYVCLGQDVVLNMGAYDVDTVNGKVDSLFHRLGNPKTSSFGKTTWKSPYNSQKTLAFLGFPNDSASLPRGFHFDSKTGELRFRPMKIEHSVIKTEIQEYRNGKIIGTVRRDMEIAVVKCPENNPEFISGPSCANPTPSIHKIYSCTNAPICFDICTPKRDSADTTALTWDMGIADGTFNLKMGKKGKTARFCWTPKTTDARKTPHEFIVSNEGCSANSTVTHKFQIFVGDTNKADFKPSIDSGFVDLKVDFANTSKNGKNWQWDFGNGQTSTSFEPTVTYTNPGWYTVSLTTSDDFGHCNSVHFDTIKVRTKPIGIGKFNKSQATVFPNPTTGLVNLASISEEGALVEIMNYQGKLVYTDNHSKGQQIDLSNFDKGVYILKVSTKSEQPQYWNLVRE